MKHLSVKGIARKFGGITGDFCVVKNIFGVDQISGCVSLREKLKAMACKQYTFTCVGDCLETWIASFDQTWTHIQVRVQLDPDNDISAETLESKKAIWKDTIERTWSNRWGCQRAGELNCPLTFEIQWVTSNEHLLVFVFEGDDRSSVYFWHIEDPGSTAAHEYGHMIGLYDEYEEWYCPIRDPVNTGTIMDNNSNNIPSRLMTRFANNIGSSVVALPSGEL